MFSGRLKKNRRYLRHLRMKNKSPRSSALSAYLFIHYDFHYELIPPTVFLYLIWPFPLALAIWLFGNLATLKNDSLYRIGRFFRYLLSI